MSERKGRSHQHIWTGNLSDLSVSLKPVEVAAQPAILMYSPKLPSIFLHEISFFSEMSSREHDSPASPPVSFSP
jgi:hypothetical protein